MIILSPKYSFSVPIDAESITPDAFLGKSVGEVSSLPIWEGNRRRALGELFKIECDEGNEEAVTIRMIGDFAKVKRIGARMSCGLIVIEGSVGMRLGEGMRGGEITVKGDADSWVGMMMKGGRIEVSGNAGDYIGSSYRGSIKGMKDGAIVVRGNAGVEAGCFMNGGLIRVGGKAEQFVGMHMRGGTILIEGDAGERVGAEMVGGTVIVLGQVPSVLPGFIVDGVRTRARVGEERVNGPFYLFKGDVAESWNGSLYVSVDRNPHLKVYESKIA